MFFLLKEELSDPLYPPSLSILTIYIDRKKLIRLRPGFLVEGIARQTDRGADPASGALGSIPMGANIFKVKIKLKLKLKTQKSEIKLKKKK